VRQDPRRLKASLEKLVTVLRRIQSNRNILGQIDRVSNGNASPYFRRESFDACEAGVEDSIRICEWAASRGKRVALVSS